MKVGRRPLAKVPALVAAGFLSLAVIAGCGKEEAKAPPNPNAATGVPNPGGWPTPGGGPVEVPAQFVAARKTFDRTCAKCHSTDPGGGGFPGGGPPGPDKGFKGFGGKGMMKGPSLAKVGADPSHTRDWLMAYMRDPRAHNPKGRMPSFDGKLSEDDLGALADYLGSLK
jgi:mono/diheme cytochrome c family protein